MSWGASKAALVGVLSGVAVAAAISMTSLGADAKSTYESPYGYDRTWNAALRLVRVDNGWKISEKDDQNGYLLFDYKSPENSKVSPVNVLVQLPQMPHYHEQVLLDSLASKMRREYGDPPERRKRPPESAPDAGADAPPE
jgi:hypothetical protein